MKKDWSHLEPNRVNHPDLRFRSDKGDHFGAFVFHRVLDADATVSVGRAVSAGRVRLVDLRVIASNGDYTAAELDASYAWEHVSVSTGNRCPTWEEMSYIKDLFWESEETVIQFHPPKSNYVNRHPFCLHLWKPLHWNIILPPVRMV